MCGSTVWEKPKLKQKVFNYSLWGPELVTVLTFILKSYSSFFQEKMGWMKMNDKDKTRRASNSVSCEFTESDSKDLKLRVNLWSVSFLRHPVEIYLEKSRRCSPSPQSACRGCCWWSVQASRSSQSEEADRWCRRPATPAGSSSTPCPPSSWWRSWLGHEWPST